MVPRNIVIKGKYSPFSLVWKTRVENCFLILLSVVTELEEQLLETKDFFLVIVGETFNSQMDSSELHNLFLTYVTSIKS